MAKKFAPRVSKKNRKKIDLSERFSQEVFRISDDKLLQGAKLTELELVQIKVKDQVRTKFNDSSLKELADNIRVNGLIQPLVVHKKAGRYTLICGERRYRAMTLLKMKSAPCFVLNNKSQDELMAIQFSENSSREALHYIDKAEGIYNYKKATGASERKIQAALGTSKSEVHRSLLIAKLPKRFKEAAKQYNIEKYVLLELDALEDKTLKKRLEKKLMSGELVKRSQLKREMDLGLKKTRKTKTSPRRKKPVVPKGVSANAFLKAMDSKTQELDVDPKTLKILRQLVEETKDMIE